MQWESILSDSVQDGRIKAVHLKKIPVLKNCDNWKIVTVIGWIDYTVKTAHYQGILVRLNGKIYFVRQAVFEAVREYLPRGHMMKIEVVD